MSYSGNGRWTISTAGAQVSHLVTTLKSTTKDYLTCIVGAGLELDIEISPDNSTWVTVASLGGSNSLATDVYVSEGYRIRPNATTGTGSFFAK